MLLISGGVARNAQVLTQNAHWIARTYEVLGKLREVFSAIQNLESGMRGYLLVGDRSFLEPYFQAPSTAHRLIQELRTLTADNSSQQLRLEKLTPLIERKITFTRQLVAQRERGDAAGAQASLAGGQGRILMEGIRQSLDEMEQEEDLCR